MRNFLTKLDSALKKNHVIVSPAWHCITPNDELILLEELPHQSYKNVITTKRLEFKACKTVPHTFIVDEIFIGFDAEGYDWSDNVGGIMVDCTDLKSAEAIEKIVAGVKKKWPEYFI